MAKSKVIKPGKFDEKALLKELEKGVEETGQGFTVDFKETTSTWETQVIFKSRQRLTKQRIEYTCFTVNEIYRFVNDGTESHTIKPKKAKVLLFRGTFSAKTMPGTIRPRNGGASGKLIAAKIVKHPGTKARNFDLTIKKIWQPKFEKNMDKAMKKGAKASNHAI